MTRADTEPALGRWIAEVPEGYFFFAAAFFGSTLIAIASV